MEIKSTFKKYSVNFIDSFEKMRELTLQQETFFIIDRIVYGLYKDKFPVMPPERFFLMDAEEEKKNMETVLAICEQMTDMPSKRNTHLVSVGGGIVQDVTGFVAANLYRGIAWTFFPTTLLASCDSCIGGKSSLNYRKFKNLLGSFYPPDEIFIYPAFFRTLSFKDYCSGLGEIVKFNVIAGKDEVIKINRDIESLLSRNYKVLEKYIRNSLEFKRVYVEEDEFDRGKRILLNYAHTFGHAFETISKYEIPHGLAIVLGMLTANNISAQRGWISPDYVNQISVSCRKLLTNINFQKEWFDYEEIMKAIKKDKKQSGKNITAVLIQDNYELGLFKDVTENETINAVRNALIAVDINI